MPRPVRLVTRFVVPQSEMPPLELEATEGMNERGENDRLEETQDLKKFRDDTLIYRTVAERMRYFPMYLYRTVEYLKKRNQRSKKMTKKIPVDKFFQERPGVQPKEQKFLTITYLGFYTNSASKNPTAKIETIISKKRGGRKRMKNKSNVKVSAGTCEVFINPSPNDPRPVPIISIPHDMLNLESASQMLAKSLVIRAVLDGNNEDAFECEQILVNDNGKCPVEAGDYEMTSTVQSPSIWVKSIGFPGDFESTPLNLPRISYRLEWTKDAQSGWVPRPQPYFAQNLPTNDSKGANKENRLIKRRSSGQQNLNNALQAANGKNEKNSVEYSFHTNCMLVHSFLQTNTYLCPWCELNCMSFFGLFKHLKVTHERFLFNFTKTSDKLLVDIKVNDKADINYGGDPTREFFKKEGGPRRISPYLEVLVWKPRRFRPPSMERMLERQAFPETTPVQTFGHNRMYYHSSTCLPIHPTEMSEDSENERDPTWLRQKTAMMIDDFTDVNEGEKEVIKLWNLHVLKEGYVGDCQRPKANKEFYARNAHLLLEKNLYRNGVLHLINQNHFNLLGAVHAYRILRPVLERLKTNQADIDRFRENYLKERAGWLASGGEGGSRDKAKEEFQAQSGPSTSSTFVTGDGTLRRKMTQPANPKPTNNGKQKIRNNSTEKDRPSRKRKFAFDECASDNPARRLRCGSDPAESGSKKKPVMRKTAH